MKALSLTQPWATLIAIGAKKIETRSWFTWHRGPLAIHAAKSFPVDAQQCVVAAALRDALIAAGVPRRDRDGNGWYEGDIDVRAFPRGAILAVCELTYCQGPLGAPGTGSLPGGVELPPPEPELSFGDYARDRYAWQLENVRRLREPVPCRGALGLWEVPADVLEKVQGQL